MITDQRMTEYLHSLESSQGPLCDRIEEEALKCRVPIIRRETAALLKVLICALRPKQILEIGTAVGYSTLLMSRVMPEGCHITTIEKYEKRIPVARRNFQRAGKEPCITLLEGDAQEILKTLSGPYDFIFMDAAKGQYLGWLPEILRLLSPGGVLFSDNVMQDGDLIESRYAVRRRDRTIHGRMRGYLFALTHTPQLQTAVVPVGDGAAVSVKKENG